MLNGFTHLVRHTCLWLVFLGGSFACTQREDAPLDPKLSEEQARKEQREQEQKDKARLRGLDSLFATQVPKPPSDARLFSRQDNKKQEGEAQYMSSSTSRNILQDGFYTKIKRSVQVEGCEYTDIFQHGLPVDVVWPGNIIDLASAQSYNPQEITQLQALRAPGRVSMAVVNGQSDLVEEVKTFEKSSVYEALNKLVGKNKKGLPADITFTSHLVHSTSEMAYFMGITQQEFDQKYKSTFAAVRWQENTYKVLVQLRQVFFTLVFDDPSPRASSLFSPELTVERFKAINKSSAPLGYISSVSYGRSFVMLIEEKRRTYRDESEIKKAVEVYKPGNQKTSPKGEKHGSHSKQGPSSPLSIVSSANIYIRQIGGKELRIDDMLTKSPDKLLKFIADNATFGPGNIGYPIAYRVKSLGDLRSVLYRNEVKDRYEFVDYEPAEDKNRITISGIKIDLKGMGTKTRGGNYPNISHHSWFKVNMLELSVWSRDLVPSHQKQILYREHEGVSSIENRRPIEVKPYVSPELGIVPNAIIKLRLSVSCRAERYTNGLLWGDRDAAEKTYDLSVEFSYDPSKKEWVARQHGSYFENDLFRKIGVHEIFNFCPVHFELKYSFRTDQVIYPKK